MAAGQSSARARPLRVGALVVGLALLAGCGGDDDDSGGAPPTAGVFVASVDGTDAKIALVTDGERLTGAYLCNEKTVSQWIAEAPLEDGKAELVARRGVSLGEASFDGDTASGDVTVAGGPQSFSAELAKGEAGLYRTTSGKAGKAGFSETGWIVLPDGTVCGSTNSTTPSGFESEPAPSKPEGKVTSFAKPFPF
jgi:hypothetical protein